MKKIAFLLCSIVLVLSACNKYDDGPKLSLNTKTHRLANTWRIDQVFETSQNGTKTDKTNDYKNGYYDYVMTINKKNTYTISYRPYNLGNYSEAGTWAFSAGKVNLIFVNSSPNSSGSAIGSIWTITRLKEKELWMRTVNSNNTTIEVHLLPQ
jgi:hypothetical protein